MKKMLCFLFVLTAFVQCISAQKKYICKQVKISFYSKAPLEDIESHNTKALSAFDITTGQIEFSVLMKGFEFEKAKMQEHFNEDYIESDKFPKAFFTGTIKNPTDLKLDRDGVYKAQVNGSLTLHGVIKPQNADAVFTVKGGEVGAVAEFNISIIDYNIKIPALVADKINKTVRIVVKAPSYQAL